MKIFGPYKSKADKRLRIIIVYDNGERTTVSYPRFIVENYLGIVLDPDEDIHHIDGNVENNDIVNLEVVHHKEHCREHSLKYRDDIQVNCVYCDTEFTLTPKQQSERFRNSNRNKFGPFCSKSCSGKYGAGVQRSNKVGIL